MVSFILFVLQKIAKSIKTIAKSFGAVIYSIKSSVFG